MPQGEYLQYGGQAIVEGVMMRSPRFFSVACRAPNGNIVLQTEALEKTWIGRQKWLKLPFLRGSLAILDAMALGTKAMRFASNVQTDARYAVESDGEKAKPGPSEAIQGMQVAAAMVVGLGIGFLLFNVLPQALAQVFGVAGKDSRGLLTNYVAEVIKLVIFLGYLALIGRLPAIRDVFRYHGAEHKAINALEAHEPLDIEHCTAQTRLHPRCGTSFAVIVFIVSFLLMPLVPRYPVTGVPGNPFLDVTVRVGMELFILPIIAGISYELIRIAGKFRNQRWVDLAFWPGLVSQKFLTTLEPTTEQTEIALSALRAVVKAEEEGIVESSDDYQYRDQPVAASANS